MQFNHLGTSEAFSEQQRNKCRILCWFVHKQTFAILYWKPRRKHQFCLDATVDKKKNGPNECNDYYSAIANIKAKPSDLLLASKINLSLTNYCLPKHNDAPLRLKKTRQHNYAANIHVNIAWEQFVILELLQIFTPKKNKSFNVNYCDGD